MSDTFIEKWIRKQEYVNDKKPDAVESEQYWKSIWVQSGYLGSEHRKDARWLKDLRNETEFGKQKKTYITRESLRRIIGRMLHWKSPGPDLDQWLLLKPSSLGI